MMNKIFLLILCSSVFAQIQPIPGWSKSGIDIAGSKFGLASPLVTDLDGDNQLDVVSVTIDGVVRAHSHNGALLWSTALPNYGCRKSDLAHSSPAIGSLLGDGNLSVVLGYGGLKGKVCGGGVVALDAKTGTYVWHFNAKTYAKLKKFYSISHGVFSSVALADVDNDGKLEIGFAGLDRNIYLLNPNGSVRWHYQAADTVFSSPTFVNIDSTPELEMIIGTDVFGNKKMKPIVKSGGYLYALRTKSAKPRALYKFRNKDIVIWLNNYEQVIQSSPAVGELISENPGLEIAVASGCFYPERNPNKIGRWLRIVSAKTGKTLRITALDNCTTSSPAIADLNNDGLNDVVISYAKNKFYNIPAGVLAYTPATSQILWKVTPVFMNKVSNQLGYFSSPVIGDLDANGSLEVAVTNAYGVTVLAGANGSHLSGNALYTRYSAASPTIVDFNKDGKNDIIAIGDGVAKGSGAIYSFTNFGVLNSAPENRTINAISWGQFKKNNYRNGLF